MMGSPGSVWLVLSGSSATVHSLSSGPSPPLTRTGVCCTKACLRHTCAWAPCSARPCHCHTLLSGQRPHPQPRPHLLCFHSTSSCLSSLGGFHHEGFCSSHLLFRRLRMLFIEQGKERKCLHAGLSGGPSCLVEGRFEEKTQCS